MAFTTPMRWPDTWTDPATLSLLKGTSVDCLLVSNLTGPIAEAARSQGVAVVDSASPPRDVTVLEGEWPGIKLAESGSRADASAGPTGNPWVDSNSWKARLAEALHPGTRVWIDATPKEPRLLAESYVMAVADAGACGASWILRLDAQLAAGIASGQPKALDSWKGLTATAGFFAAHPAWRAYVPEAVLGVVSSFSGENEFFGGEVLNLVARTNQQYRILPKNAVTGASFERLRAVLYADAEPPAPELRKLLVGFAEAGGLVIAGPKWGQVSGAPAPDAEPPRYDVRTTGKGRVAVAKGDAFDDPYMVAADAMVLVSHRYELLRFWNGGAVGSLYTVAASRRSAIVHMLFYGGGRGDQSVRVAGAFRKATLWVPGQTGAQRLDTVVQKDGLELHLPPVSVYAAAELEA